MSEASAKQSSAACFICGVGGWDTAMTLAIFFGLSSLGFIFLFVWAVITKQFKDTNTLSDEPLKAEHFAEQKTKGEPGNADR